jgi:hypothetical protein
MSATYPVSERTRVRRLHGPDPLNCSTRTTRWGLVTRAERARALT